MNFYLLTLGCPKNVADSEGMTRLLMAAGHTPVAKPGQANVLIVNTCGFIDIARAESIRALLTMGRRKRRGQVLIAAGCLAERYATTLRRQIPAVDAVLGTRRWQDIARLVGELEGQMRGRFKGSQAREEAMPEIGGAGVQRGASRYLKIADGCSASCAFCVIPRIKGPYWSKPEEEVLAEAREMVAQGAREIVLVAQDVTLYGSDRGQRDGLAILIERILEEVPNLPWLRLLYAYPQHITPRLIRVMAEHPQVCKYLDLPLQHAHPATLQRMGRPSNVEQARALIARLREAMPEIALRSSFIVGYPGETEEEFAALLDFLWQVGLDRAGFFMYSREEGTMAATLPNQIPQRVKRERYHRAMEVQRQVSLKRNRRWVGKTLDVLIEGVSQEASVPLVVGRSFRDAPEVDGLVLVQGDGLVGQDPSSLVGRILPVRVTGATEYDLWGEAALS